MIEAATIKVLSLRRRKRANRNIILSALLVVLSLTFFHSPARAWEADLHYGLVKWLAVQASFDLDSAEIIAAGSESADETYVLKATTVMTVHVCLNRWPLGKPSKEAARHVQRHHFSSGGFIPSAPKHRAVEPGAYGLSNSGNLWVRQELGQRDNARRETRLTRFGNALHPLADSWSHQGEPDKPPGCPPDLIWSHSRARNGWNSHDADLTHLHPDDTRETARSIFRFLLDFARELGQDPPMPVQWKQLLPDVDRFASAKTAGEKLDWFESVKPALPGEHFTTYPCFLQQISLDGHKELPCFDHKPPKRFVRAAGPAPSARADRLASHPAGFVEWFLNRWLVEGVKISAQDDSIDFNSVVDNILGQAVGRLDVSADKWLDTLFGMWLIPDHGLVNRLGHGLPSTEEHSELFELTQARTLRFESLNEAIRAPDDDGPYSLYALDPEGTEQPRYAAVFQFHHVPLDTVALIMGRGADERWKVIQLFWLPH